MLLKIKIYLIYYFVISYSLLLKTSLFPQQVHLAWTLVKNPNISHYGIYRTTHIDSSFTLIDTVNHPDSIYSDRNLQWNMHYYYVATSVDRFGNESGFSNMVDTTLSSAESVVLSARVIGNDVILKWFYPPGPSNYYGFEIQRSENEPLKFKKISVLATEINNLTERLYQFVDKNLSPGRYYYRLKLLDYNGAHQITLPIQVVIILPEELRLYQNYPNPFNYATTISYSLAQSSQVKLTIFAGNGHKICNLVDDLQEAGHYEVTWEALDYNKKTVSSGVYYYKISTPGCTKFRKMVLVK